MLQDPQVDLADTVRLAAFISTVGMLTARWPAARESRTVICPLARFPDGSWAGDTRPTLHRFNRRHPAVLETFTYATFAGRRGELFRIRTPEGGTLETQLIEAEELGSGGGGRRSPFSLVFRGPKQIVLPQRIYRVEHEEIGSFDLFLVPIGPDGEEMRYEAIFT